MNREDEVLTYNSHQFSLSIIVKLPTTANEGDYHLRIIVVGKR